MPYTPWGAASMQLLFFPPTLYETLSVPQYCHSNAKATNSKLAVGACLSLTQNNSYN